MVCNLYQTNESLSILGEFEQEYHFCAVEWGTEWRDWQRLTERESGRVEEASLDRTTLPYYRESERNYNGVTMILEALNNGPR